MKKLITIALLVYCTSSLFSQYFVKYDFVTKQVTHKNYYTYKCPFKRDTTFVKKGNNVVFQVSNINRLNYKVEFSHEQIVIPDYIPQWLDSAISANMLKFKENQSALLVKTDTVNADLDKFNEITNDLLSIYDVITELSKLSNISNELRDKYINKITEVRAKYKGSIFTSGINDLLKLSAKLQKKHGVYNDGIENLIKLFAKIDLKKTDSSIILVLEMLEHNTLFTVSSDVIQVKADSLKLKAEIKPRFTTDYDDVSSKTIITQSILVRGGWKVNYTTGTFFNFGLNDKVYNFSPIANDSLNFTIVDETPTDFFNPMLGGILSFTKVTRCKSSFGFSIGAGLDSKNLEDTNFLFGLTSLHHTKKLTFAITGGVSVARRNNLKPTYQLNQTINKKLIPLESISTKTYSQGWFIGISLAQRN